MYIETQFCSDFPINPIPYLSSKYPDPAVFGCISATAGLGVLQGARWGAHSARPPEKRKGHHGRLDTHSRTQDRAGQKSARIDPTSSPYTCLFDGTVVQIKCQEMIT